MLSINMEIKFVVDGHHRPIYDDDESRELLGNDFEPLLRAFCVRNGILSHAPGTNEEVVEEIVKQLELERCNEWVLVYYLKALDRLMGPTIDTLAVDAMIVAALGDIKKRMQDPCGFGPHERFWAQFDNLAELMIAAHEKPEITPEGKVQAPKRNREAYEHDGDKRGCEIQL